MKKLNYNDWMAYIYNTIYGTSIEKKEMNEVGNRSLKQIQKEIEELRQIDKLITDKVRSQYTIKK
tara:strand:- start:96 stop:290 length:195 start_codon:yes stop_codon:yes gene_type:complete